MKRSEINTIIEDVKLFCKQQNFHLPPFAFWTVQDWQDKGSECDEVRDCGLGWDVTDYGSGNFEEIGLAHFTLRNGHPTDNRYPKTYCEKILIVAEGQLCPDHHHRVKTEDIINRCGGNLMIRVQMASEGGELTDDPVRVSLDGSEHTFEPQEIISLAPGESITLAPHIHHRFWAEPGTGTVLAGEVSSVNDDVGDNVYIPQVPRFPEPEEDEPPVHLLCSDYDTFLG